LRRLKRLFANRALRRLARSTSGLAMTEFALSLPLLFTVGLWGVETANQAITQMELSQLAIHIADNASRIGDTSMLENRKIYESDINDLLLGANIQGGSRLDLFKHGRVIISSLEVYPGTEDQQYIHWQRCKGEKQVSSSYGQEGDGSVFGIAGMGPPGEEVIAFDDEAVIFVEVQYDYQPLIGEMFTYRSDLSSIASFNVRDDRDLSQIYQRDASNPDPIASCSTYSSFS
jgi:hypothetical protein